MNGVSAKVTGKAFGALFFLLSITPALVPAQTRWDVGASPNTVFASYVSASNTLFISGSGNMKNGNPRDPKPWSSSVAGIVIENGVTSIGDYAFSGIVGLRSVVISGSVTRIGLGAFSGCRNLEIIASAAAVPPVVASEKTSFMDVSSASCEVYVPRNSMEAYGNAPVWEKFHLLDVLWDLPSVITPGSPASGSAAVVAPVGSPAFDMTAGPNPAARDGGVVRFFAGAATTSKETTPPPSGAPRHGGELSTATGTLTIYDATGNVVRKIDVNDVETGHALSLRDNDNRRAIATWDLRDARGREVSAGAYLVRGTVTVNGKREKVSLMVGVR